MTGEVEGDEPASNAGRPTLFKEEFVGQAEKLCMLGATDDEMADFFGVHRSTLYRWKLDHPEFCDAVKTAKEAADERVERSLYQKATGYNVKTEQAVKIKTEQFKEEVEVVEVEQHIPADTTAAIFWLKNRRSAAWRDKREVEHSGEVNVDGAELLQRVRDEVRDIFGDRAEAGPFDGSGSLPH